MSKFLSFFIIAIVIIPVVTIGDGVGDGNFEFDLDNDAPIIINWYDSATLIPPDNSVTFYLIFNDIDNSSSELTAFIFYSNDSFALQNNSVSMNFAIENPIDFFRFTYLWPGQPYGTYFQYYFVVYDGFTYVKKPTEAGVYFDIQWDFAVAPGNPPSIDEIIIPFFDDDESTTDIIIPFMIFIGLIVIGISIMGFNRRSRIRDRKPLNPVSTSRRNWRGSQTGRWLEPYSKKKK